MGIKGRAADSAQRVEVANREQWRAWLAANHRQAAGIWLVSYKKHHANYLPWRDVVQEALCFGWVDSRTRRVDEDRTMVYVSPRKPGSTWSGLNKRHVAELEAAGTLRPAGRAKIDAAKRDGSWTLLDDVEALVVPADLAAALDGTVGAREGYEHFTSGSKRAILWWIKSAKTQPTREARIQKTAQQAAVGQSAVG